MSKGLFLTQPVLTTHYERCFTLVLVICIHVKAFDIRSCMVVGTLLMPCMRPKRASPVALCDNEPQR